MHDLARKLREKMAAGQPALGTFLVDFAGPAVAQVLAAAGFDFLMIDLEHGNHDPRQVEATIEACLAADVCPLVRTPSEGREILTRCLDAGAGGVVVPAIRSMEQVRQAVNASKYRPVGRRGVHLYRGHTRHQAVEPRAFIEEANRDLLTLIQIELVEAIELVEQIAATDGVDGLYVGPGDLSVDLGVPGQWDAPVLQNAISRITDACRRHRKIAACHADDMNRVGTLVAMGVRMIGHYCDIGLLARGASEAAQTFRKAAERPARA